MAPSRFILQLLHLVNTMPLEGVHTFRKKKIRNLFETPCMKHITLIKQITCNIAISINMSVKNKINKLVITFKKKVARQIYQIDIIFIIYICTPIVNSLHVICRSKSFVIANKQFKNKLLHFIWLFFYLRVMVGDCEPDTGSAATAAIFKLDIVPILIDSEDRWVMTERVWSRIHDADYTPR